MIFLNKNVFWTFWIYTVLFVFVKKKNWKICIKYALLILWVLHAWSRAYLYLSFAVPYVKIGAFLLSEKVFSEKN